MKTNKFDTINLNYIIDFKSKHMSYKKTVYKKLNRYSAFIDAFWFDTNYLEFNKNDRLKIHSNLILEVRPINIITTIVFNDVKHTNLKSIYDTVLKEIKK